MSQNSINIDKNDPNLNVNEKAKLNTTDISEIKEDSQNPKIILPFKGITPVADVSEFDVAVSDDLPKWLKNFLFLISLAFAFFGIWSNSFGQIDGMRKAGLFLAFTLCLVFLMYPFKIRGKRVLLVDCAFALLGASVGLYTFFTTMRFASTLMKATTLDYIMGVLALVLVLEATRRVVGNVLAVLPILFTIYALFGDRLVGVFKHFPILPQRFLIRMYMVDEGIYGITTQTASSFIFLFVLFGALLGESGVAALFNDLATKIAGWSSGGPAKIACISSALMGTISGSAAANVATTGAFTIPLMKKTGFSPAFAGAVEAVASTGGMIMPPVMGAAAFLMAQYLGVSYNVIMKAAIIPALLYYTSCFFWIHFEARKLGLVGVPAKEIPPLTDMGRRVFLLVPLVVIIVGMLNGYTPTFAAFIGMISTVIVGYIQKDRITIKKILFGLSTGAKTALTAIVACIAAGIIVGVCAMTGLGSVISYNIMQLSGGSLFIALVLTAIASLVLSMGLPATACYIMVAIVIAPALVNMGAAPLAAHFFVFYFSCISNITPPVAIASYTAAGISGGKPFHVAWTAMKIAAPGFLIPFLLVYNPILLFQQGISIEMLLAVLTAIIGTIFIAIGGVGYTFSKCHKIIRLAYCAGALALIVPGWKTDLAGVLVIGISMAVDYFLNKKKIQVQS